MFYEHKKILFNPKYKNLGLITFPYVFIFEFLAPIIEAFGILFTLFLIFFGQVNWTFAPLILFYSYAFAVMISSIVIIWDQMTFKYYNTTGEVLKLFVIALIEPFLYHPMIMFFSLKGYFSFITSRELAWGTMTRQGFEKDKDGNDKNSGSKEPEEKSGIFNKLKKNKESDTFEDIKP
ncbi:hypothetical protein [Polaribacter ponticola]|uniref:Glycosyl transferase family 2 n=1 Tax=Polaribacter ponticola TaxID=2978475 RepID=A0ABT5S4I2_9FLAO|nr:hypothetical protein [Polaribacter sp. MSW5]MDD7913017.1 hypothetical protein [Polaribacter sp. MSW5]